MKKFLAFLMIGVMAFAVPAFSMAKKPAVETTYLQCTQNVYSACAEFGDPWVPNFKYQIDNPTTYNKDGFVVYSLDAEGNKIPLVLCKDAKKIVYNGVTYNAEICYNPDKVEFKFNEWKACSEGHYAQCKLKYGK